MIQKLRQNGFAVERGRGFAGVSRLLLPRNPDDVPTVVRLLRSPETWPGERVPHVQPHHLVIGNGGNMHGNPGQPPRPAPPLADPDPEHAGDGEGVAVAVLDTGMSGTAATDHPVWIGTSYLARPDEVDAAYSTEDLFALEGGHGTFVAGVVRQAAPAVRVDPERVLDPNGIGDEEGLVLALGSFDEQVRVVNMSLGCFTQDDVASEPLRRALAAVPEEVVLVASAANQGTTRPNWPAAFDRVVAVAAVARDLDGVLTPACYSNHGHWVDACAVGNRTSTYLKGRWFLPGDPAPEQFDLHAYWLGTSFAAPHVAGRIAALMTTGGLSATQARDQLLLGSEFFPGYGVLVD
ncbi:S8 family peptidase [Umezawaea beigongshangensis]|uniref:S8 family peptidase n=1 Tax=Umezawaea beigongshangensis TaxID=2780383 RepID=UPI0027DD0581|nr:S8 family serine peptidase [Umezawaea beigongshangensis]